MALRVAVREFPWIPRRRMKEECIDLKKKRKQKIKKKAERKGGGGDKLEKPCQNYPQNLSNNKAQH